MWIIVFFLSLMFWGIWTSNALPSPARVLRDVELQSRLSDKATHCGAAKVDILNKLGEYGFDMNVNNVAFTFGSSENFCRDATKSHLYIGNCTTLCLHRVMKSWDSGDFGMHFVFSLNASEHYLLGYRSWNHGLQLLTVDLDSPMDSRNIIRRDRYYFMTYGGQGKKSMDLFISGRKYQLTVLSQGHQQLIGFAPHPLLTIDIDI